MDIIAALSSLDLSEHEAKVYVSLLSLGRTNAGPIIESCSLHRQLVYKALASLEEKELLTVIQRNNRKHFQATSPDNLLKQIESKQRIAESLMPKLHSLVKDDVNRLEVRTTYGAMSFFENLKTLIDSAAASDKVMRIVGGANHSDFYAALGSNYDEYVKYGASAGISKNLIAPQSAISGFKDVFGAEGKTELRTMDAVLSSPTYTRITEEMVSIEMYTPEVTVIQIYNRPIATGHLEHFNALWKQASKV